MSKPIVVHLIKPIHGPGALTNRAVIHEMVFTEEVFGKSYKEEARNWATTHAVNVSKVEGLDENSEKEISVARKKIATE